MTGAEELTDPIVSIQDARGVDAVRGHLAWGELITPRLVAVRGSTDWAREPLRFEVLLAARPGERDPGTDSGAETAGEGEALPGLLPVERIKPLRIEVIPPADDGSPRGALVWLAQASAFPAPYSGSLATIDPAAREAPADLAAPIPDWDPAEVLGPIAALEEELLQALVRPWAGAGDDRSRMWWCFIFGGC
ncbi:hypothetical protein V1639_10420 [Pseudarthrobacter sp. J75]|uniref:hypothetical protein n=1 Tax=unclassified Pseudarthrobacter TaxID=2647000 RepID=UPI002E815C26|nr:MULTISPECIES: hypothetical protein [unclassified Pseudarthrobacter]MEE2522967.1 hypothetical protein [Pseudarthrobacter sp. J47]MEE2529439.1 hypothetical protein [Pseudarthrobacter sp. J75]MEE2568643.1 hypothetical protein [Pseudarthrobacter sp. J64]